MPKKIGLLGAIAIGIGGMVGGGIFAVLGEAVSLAHGATAVAFLFAGVVALFTAYSYSKLSVKFQNRGGTVVFIDEAFKHNLLSGSINFMLWLSYLITISLYAVAFASYGETFFTAKSFFLKHLLISIAIILPLIINLLSATFVSKSETIIVVIKVVLLIFIIISGFSYINPENLSPAKWSSSISILIAGMIIFVAYEGFELIANAAEDIKSPDKNLPRAFFSSVIIVIILYILIAVITTGTVSESELVVAKDYALAVAAKPALGQLGFTIVSIAALLATFSAINATIYGNARLGYIIAKDGELPEIFEIEKRSIPETGVLVTAAISLVIANSINLSEIAIIGSAGFLLIFFIINLAALKLYNEINANKSVLIISSIFSALALFVLIIHTLNTNVRALFVFILFILISIFFEVLYGKLQRGHFFHRNYNVKS
jgi:amino acid transporter